MNGNWYDVLPAVGTFLMGPAGGIVGSGVQWLADKFGASEKTVEGIKQTLSGMTPTQLLEAKKFDIEFQMYCMDHSIKLDMAQIQVNIEQAKSADPFTSRPRPFIMWVCGIAFAYATIIEPVFRFVAQVVFKYAGAFPAIDTNLTMQVMMALLGLGAMRSWDKRNGVAS